MKIISVKSQNFRTLEDFELKFNSDYCTLSGQNNAGKSAVIKIITHFLQSNDETRFYYNQENSIDYKKDKTQWADNAEIKIAITLSLNKEIDSEVFFVLEKLSTLQIQSDVINIEITQTIFENENITTKCFIKETELEEQASSEILKKIKSSKSLVIHNSTNQYRQFYYLNEGLTEILDVHISDLDREKILQAEKNLQRKVQNAAKQHKDALAELLGKLDDKYQVELTTIERGFASRFPLSVKLTDRSVEVPLNDWGTGTQNRTKILISILDAVRIQNAEKAENRTTPIVLIEEPESFLHPSAQAEFGQILNDLATELQIQMIITTHSPNMLNQTSPDANILLERKLFRGKLKQTEICNTSGDNWMLPFAKNLGVIADEFSPWKSIFESKESKVVLVEGEIDKKYFEHIQSQYPDIYLLDSDVDIVPYGGKDALKNTQLLNFMLSKFNKVFITFDLDVEKEVEKSLISIGLEKNKNYCSVGKANAGEDCIEGLLPDNIKPEIYSREASLVSAIGSTDTKARNNAKQKIKNFLLEEFISNTYNTTQLKEFKNLFSKISKALK